MIVLAVTGVGLAIGGPLFLYFWARDQFNLWRDSRR